MRSDFVIPVNKPLHWTSFDVVNKLRYKLKEFPFEHRVKVGHAGTLDPLATGLLVICTGKCTKQISDIQEGMKTYRGIFKLGSTTPSYDLETEIDNTFPTSHITKQMILDTTSQFKGAIEQVPPVFSALKVNGKKAYEQARKGQMLEMNSREVFIEKFEIHEIQGEEIHFELICGKGTYVRSLAFDFGKKLDSGAHLIQLERTKIGSYELKNAIEIDDFKTYLEKQVYST